MYKTKSSPVPLSLPNQNPSVPFLLRGPNRLLQHHYSGLKLTLPTHCSHSCRLVNTVGRSSLPPLRVNRIAPSPTDSPHYRDTSREFPLKRSDKHGGGGGLRALVQNERGSTPSILGSSPGSVQLVF